MHCFKLKCEDLEDIHKQHNNEIFFLCKICNKIICFKCLTSHSKNNHNFIEDLDDLFLPINEELFLNIENKNNDSIKKFKNEIIENLNFVLNEKKNINKSFNDLFKFISDYDSNKLESLFNKINNIKKKSFIFNEDLKIILNYKSIIVQNDNYFFMTLEENIKNEEKIIEKLKEIEKFFKFNNIEKKRKFNEFENQNINIVINEENNNLQNEENLNNNNNINENIQNINNYLLKESKINDENNSNNNCLVVYNNKNQNENNSNYFFYIQISKNQKWNLLYIENNNKLKIIPLDNKIYSKLINEGIPLKYSKTIFCNNILYITGGFTLSKKQSSKVSIIKVINKKLLINNIESMNVPRYKHNIAYLKKYNCIVCCGGAEKNITCEYLDISNHKNDWKF